MDITPDDEVLEYIRKRKRENKPISVTQLRKNLNIGYKKAKRLYDEVNREGKKGRGAAAVVVTAPSEVDEEEEGDEDEKTEEEEESDGGELDAFTLSNCLLKAANFAANKHKLQKRKDKEQTPYINHPLGVAWSLSKEGGVKDVDVLQAAMLHDTVEDTNTTFEELEKKFGGKVASIVKEVTDDKSLPKDERKKLQVAHAPHITKQAKHVKLADKLYNLRDLIRSAPPGWDAKRTQGYFAWAYEVTKGLRGTNIGLEEKLDEVFASQFEFEGKKYPTLVPEAERAAFLKSYYTSMKQVSD